MKKTMTVDARKVNTRRGSSSSAQGITALARSVQNNNDRIELEVVAGKVLDKAAA